MKPWELAKERGMTVICRIMGPMVGAYYPYRKTGDLYIIADGVIFCCQCKQQFPMDKFLKHVTSHNRARHKYSKFILDPNLMKPEEA